jgi:hypothetical protein
MRHAQDFGAKKMAPQMEYLEASRWWRLMAETEPLQGSWIVPYLTVKSVNRGAIFSVRYGK